MALQSAEQRLQERGRTADHACQGRALELDAFACIDLALAVQGNVICVLAYQHMTQQARPGQAAGNRPPGRWRLNNGLALGACVLWTHMADHLEARRHHLQHFGHVLAKKAQGTIAARAGAPFSIGWLVHDGLAWQVSGKGFACRAFALNRLGFTLV